MSTEFNLPGSSFEEVQKILKGYSHASENASLETLSKLTGLHTTVISRNNKFLSDIGLISGGMKKSATELGKKLGRALEHKQIQDVQKYWAEAVRTNETVSSLITTVRIKGEMAEKDLSDHILYVSGQKNNSGNKTGATCVVDVLIEAKLLEVKDGKLSVAKPVEQSIDEVVKAVKPLDVPSLLPNNDNLNSQAVPAVPAIVANNIPQIAINIQLHLPETDNAEVYEKLFKALREQLINPKD
ncbi:hypothetical protein [Shewanella mangrovisoli]|uniref:hypothetical protein n=1 Tax=Shewanella mangrovisoli TaxID=2864211 RepID=UPI0035B8459C